MACRCPWRGYGGGGLRKWSGWQGWSCCQWGPSCWGLSFPLSCFYFYNCGDSNSEVVLEVGSRLRTNKRILHTSLSMHNIPIRIDWKQFESDLLLAHTTLGLLCEMVRRPLPQHLLLLRINELHLRQPLLHLEFLALLDFTLKRILQERKQSVAYIAWGNALRPWIVVILLELPLIRKLIENKSEIYKRVIGVFVQILKDVVFAVIHFILLLANIIGRPSTLSESYCSLLFLSSSFWVS